MKTLRQLFKEAPDVATLQQRAVDAVDALEAAALAFAKAHAEWLAAGGKDPQAGGKDPMARRKEIASGAVSRGLAGGK